MAWSQGSRAQFLQTQWSIVLAARDPTEPAARHALEELCESYRPPLYGFLRRRGLTQHDAEDAVQSFFLHLLAKPFLENVAPVNGRFRTFLLTCLERYLFNDWNRQQAAKRGGGTVTVSLDALGGELSGPFLEKAAVLEFDRRWAASLVLRTFAQLRAECHRAGKMALFEELQEHVLHQSEPADSTGIAQRLGLSPEAVRQSRSRLRRRFRELLGATVAETLLDPGEVEHEARYLLSICGNDDAK